MPKAVVPELHASRVIVIISVVSVPITLGPDYNGTRRDRPRINWLSNNTEDALVLLRLQLQISVQHTIASISTHIDGIANVTQPATRNEIGFQLRYVQYIMERERSSPDISITVRSRSVPL